MSIYSCNICINRNNKDVCAACTHSPVYRNVLKTNRYQEYEPVCPRGYKDCKNDPSWIKQYHPECYKDRYGDKTLQEAAEFCRIKMQNDPYELKSCYNKIDT